VIAQDRAAAQPDSLDAIVPAVSPVIGVAWIAAGTTGAVEVVGIVGTVATSFVSSRNTTKATTRTVETGVASTMATLAAAREDRLWEKRATAYEETMAALLHRQGKHQHDLRCTDWTTIPNKGSRTASLATSLPGGSGHRLG
jgi:hypothetical protein